MKCGNKGCEYELYLDEARSLVCPSCTSEVQRSPEMRATIPKEVLRQADKVAFRATNYRWGHNGLIVLPICIYAILSETLFKDLYLALNRFDGFDIQSPVILGVIYVCVVLGFQELYNQMRLIFHEKTWYLEIKQHILVKSGVWSLCAIAAELFWAIPEVTRLHEVITNHQLQHASEVMRLASLSTGWLYALPIIFASSGLAAGIISSLGQREVAVFNQAMIDEGVIPYPALSEGEDDGDNAIDITDVALIADDH